MDERACDFRPADRSHVAANPVRGLPRGPVGRDHAQAGRQAPALCRAAWRRARGSIVALIDPADVAGQLEAAIRLAQRAGFEPVPHVPARFMQRPRRSRRAASRRSPARRASAQMLVLGGGAPQPLGKYDAAIQLLETGLFETNGVTPHRHGRPPGRQSRHHPASWREERCSTR